MGAKRGVPPTRSVRAVGAAVSLARHSPVMGWGSWPRRPRRKPEEGRGSRRAVRALAARAVAVPPRRSPG